MSPVAAIASSCESWMSSQIWSVQRRGGLPRGRRQEGGADDDSMSMPWVPGGRRHMCPKAPRRRLRMVVVSGCCPVRAYTSVLVTRSYQRLPNILRKALVLKASRRSC